MCHGKKNLVLAHAVAAGAHLPSHWLWACVEINLLPQDTGPLWHPNFQFTFARRANHCTTEAHGEFEKSGCVTVNRLQSLLPFPTCFCAINHFKTMKMINITNIHSQELKHCKLVKVLPLMRPKLTIHYALWTPQKDRSQEWLIGLIGVWVV